MAGTRVTLPAGWPERNEGSAFVDHVRGALGCSLLQYYCSRHGQSATASDWRARIEAGLCKVDGAVCQDPDAPIPPNAVLQYHRPPWAEPEAPCYVDVLYQDPQLLVLHKPSGLQVLRGGPFDQRCVLTLLQRYYAEHSSLFAGQPAPVHRLGRGTSGVLVCACSDVARRALSRDLEQHGQGSGGAAGSRRRGSGGSKGRSEDAGGGEGGSIRKIYRALVQGVVGADEGEVAVPIGRLAYPGVLGGLFAAVGEGGGGKPARSRFRVVRRDAVAGSTVVEVEIFTGRPHQIRIHMAAAGHPLVGDPLYGPGGVPRGAAAPGQPGQVQGQPGGCSLEPQAKGGREAAGRGGGQEERGTGAAEGALPATALPGDCGYLLHCWVMEFGHPVTGERLRVCSPPPPELA